MVDQSIVMDSGTARVSDEGNRPRSVENGSRRKYFSRRTSTTKIEANSQLDDR